MNKLTIGIADMKMARNEGVLITYALGSCIGICLYDPFIRLGALVHIMLPINMETNRTSPPDVEQNGADGSTARPYRGKDCGRRKDV